MHQFTKNHVSLRALDDHRVELGVSPELQEALGAPLRFQFRESGIEVGRGEVFGRVDGTKQSCRLHAPFAVVVESQGEGFVTCRRSSDESETLLDREAYLRFFATGIPR